MHGRIRSIFIEKHTDSYESPRFILWFSILIGGLVTWALIGMLTGPMTSRNGVIGMFILGFQLLGIVGLPFAIALLVYTLWRYFRRRNLGLAAFTVLVVVSVLWIAYGVIMWIAFLPPGFLPR